MPAWARTGGAFGLARVPAFRLGSPHRRTGPWPWRKQRTKQQQQSGPQRSTAHLPARLGGSPASLLLLSECEREGREQQEPLLLVLLPFFFSSDGTPYRNDRCQLLIPAARFSLYDDDGEYSFACLLVLAPFRAPAVDVLCPSVRRAAPDRRFIYHTQGCPLLPAKAQGSTNGSCRL